MKYVTPSSSVCDMLTSLNKAFHEVLMLRFNNETSLQSAVRNEEFVLSSVKPYQITDLGDLKKTWRNGLKPGEAVDMSITILLGTKCLLCGSKIPFTELRNKTWFVSNIDQHVNMSLT